MELCNRSVNLCGSRPAIKFRNPEEKTERTKSKVINFAETCKIVVQPVEYQSLVKLAVANRNKFATTNRAYSKYIPHTSWLRKEDIKSIVVAYIRHNYTNYDELTARISKMNGNTNAAVEIVRKRINREITAMVNRQQGVPV